MTKTYSRWFNSFTAYFMGELSPSPALTPLQPDQSASSEITKEKIQQAASISAHSASQSSLKQQFKPSSALSDHGNQQVKEALTNSGLLNLGPRLEGNIKEYDRLWAEH
jgi:hypothetical protein